MRNSHNRNQFLQRNQAFYQMSSVLRSLVLLSILSIAFQANAQNNYSGEFRGKIPIGEHIQYDEDGKLEIVVDYSRGGLIKQIEIKNSNKTFAFPPKLDSIEWSLIKDGLWINKIDQGEDFVQTFPQKSTVKCHFAGYLMDGQSFDNSFVRAQPFEAPLNHLITGFSLGVWNVPVGEVRVIKIAPKLAYKDRMLASIPPNSTIVYFIYRIK